MLPVNIADLRTDYLREALDERDVATDPIPQFERWLGEAIKAALPEPTSMSLATADAAGRPSVRIVLLKGVDPGGLVFFTNYHSRKGTELAANPRAALLFHWVELQRQVRVEGTVGTIATADSDSYFASRPRPSRLSALASPQSEAVAGRAALEARFEAMAARFPEGHEDIPRPPHWGGYRLVPASFEFWQGRRSRLHDRIRYRRAPQDPGLWVIDRLAP
ncbi:MAG: pyridoxamine 5'-phosphate oxidase [Casimicrobiaceae bacterium]